MSRLEDIVWAMTDLVKLVLYTMGIGTLYHLTKLLAHYDAFMQVQTQFIGGMLGQ